MAVTDVESASALTKTVSVVIHIFGIWVRFLKGAVAYRLCLYFLIPKETLRAEKPAHSFHHHKIGNQVIIGSFS